MAEQILERVEGELNCHVCLDTYENPKLLNCFHVYCKKCLVKMVREDERRQRTIICPECTKKTPVPSTGVADLQAAFHFNRLLDIVGGQREYPRGERKCCPEHQDEELKLYCEDCGKLVCYKCVIGGGGGGKHHNHEYEYLEDAFRRYKDEMNLSQARLTNQMDNVERALQKLYACRNGILSRISSLEIELDGETRKPLLMVQARQIAQKNLDGLDGEEEKLKNIQSQLKSCLDFMKKSMDSDSHYEVLKMKGSVVRQIKELTTPFQSDVSLGSPDVPTAGYSMNIMHFKLRGKELQSVSSLNQYQIFLVWLGEN